MSTPAMTPKNFRKLVDRLNRIKNLVPGQSRVWRLGDVADELQITLDMEDVHPEARAKLEGLVLFVRRLEYDLIVLNEVAHDKPRARGVARNDPTHWRGPRP